MPADRDGKAAGVAARMLASNPHKRESQKRGER